MKTQVGGTQDVLNLAMALDMAIEQGFFAREYAKSIFTAYLKHSGFDVEKKESTSVKEEKVNPVS